MYKYQTNTDDSKGIIKIINDVYWYISPSSPSYQEYLEWKAEGNAPDPANPEPVPVKYIPVKTVFERIETLGKTDAVWKALTTAQQLKFLTLQEGIAVNDTDVTALLSALGIDVSQVLY